MKPFGSIVRKLPFGSKKSKRIVERISLTEDLYINYNELAQEYQKHEVPENANTGGLPGEIDPL